VKKTIIPFFIPFKGCPYTCTYCDQRAITGAPVQSVSSDIQAFFLRHGSDYDEVEVGFFGGTFTCLPREEQRIFLDAVQPFISKGQVTRIRCSTRPDVFTEFDSDFYHHYNMTHFELGVQTFTDKYLHFLGRNYSSETIESTCVKIEDAGFSYGLQLMCGFPEQTKEEFLADITHLIQLQPEDCRIYPLSVLKGTALALQNKKNTWRFEPLTSIVEWVATAAFLIESSGIRILRMGLPHSENLERSVIAGTYHPSFADLVRKKQIGDQIALHKTGLSSKVWVHPKDAEYVRSILKKEHLLIIADETVQRGCIILKKR